MDYVLPVRDSQDLRRIENLPRRTFEMPPPMRVVKTGRPCRCAAMGRDCIEEIRPIQVGALEEAVRIGGLLAPITVGAGKTLLGILLPIVLQARRAVLLVLAGEEMQAKREWEWLGQHLVVPRWGGSSINDPIEDHPNPDACKSPTILHVISYRTLSDPKNATILLDLGPDLDVIIGDEGQKLRYTDTATLKRVLACFQRNPRLKFCTWSGTLTATSIKEISHLGAMALHEGSPFPIRPDVVDEWASCLDARRRLPAPAGELARLMDGSPLDTPRDAVHRRMVETPGVVYSAKRDFELPPLEFHCRKLPASFPGPALSAAQLKLEKEWVRPDGEELMYQLDMSRTRNELQHGFYNRWDFGSTPTDVVRTWKQRRSEWARALHKFLKHSSKPGLDSPYLVERAQLVGSSEGRPVQMMPEYWAWNAVAKTCDPKDEAVWIDDSWLEDVRQWAEEHQGLVWFTHDAVGEKLSKWMPIYHEKAALVRDLPSLKKRALGLAAKACGTGTNGLQYIHYEQLLCCQFMAGAQLEQLLGRLCRPGQKNKVRTFYYDRDKEVLTERARDDDAQYIQQMMGTPQLLRTGTWV